MKITKIIATLVALILSLTGLITAQEELVIQGEASPNRYFDVVGRRAFLMGYEAGSMEAWLTPLKVAHNISFSFNRDDFPAPVAGDQLAKWITVRPDSTQLLYAYEDFNVKARFFVPRDEKAIVIILSPETAKELTVSFSFTPEMKPMWPAALGGQSSYWDSKMKAFVLSESRRQHNVLIGSPSATGAFATPAHRLSEVPNRFDIRVSPENSGKKIVIVMAGGRMEREKAKELFTRISQNWPKLLEERREHARYLREELLSIDYSRMTAWMLPLSGGKVSIDDGISTNPDLGTGLVAGYGLSGRSERPGFAWFFGGDLFQAQFSMNGYGAHQEVKQCLTLIRKNQRQDGKIMHELSQGAGYLNWFEDFPYGYYHLETSAYYIVSVANYVRHSGDIQFLKDTWPSIIKAYQYTLTTDSDGDGLPENHLGGLGAIEVGEFREMTKTDIYVAGVWVGALKAMSELATAIKTELPVNFAKIRETASASLATCFFNKEKGFHGLAINKKNKPIPELTAWAGLPMTMNLLPEEDARSTLRQVAGPKVSTDWVCRMLENGSSLYDPVHYNLGAAWGVLTGYAGMAHYNYQMPEAGWQLIAGMRNLTFEDSRGDISEVYSGDYHIPLKQSVDHQMFSTGGMMGPIIRGLIGFEANALNNSVRLHPQLPAEWTSFKARKLKFTNSSLNFTMSRTGDIAYYKFQADSYDTRLKFDFAPSFPLDTQIASVKIDGKTVEFSLEQKGTVQQLHLFFTLESATTVEVKFKRMNWLELPDTIGKPGSISQQIRFIYSEKTENGYKVDLAGRSGWTYNAVFHSLTESKNVAIKFPGNDDGSFKNVSYTWR